MTVKITDQIVGYAVKKAEAATAKEEKVEVQSPEPVQMSEQIERPEVLVGTTYKIKPPVVDHAMYITINDVILNEGTEHEQQRPYEIFINSKEVNHFQWVIAMTRVLSACFRKGGDITFVVEELKSVYDPNGGFFKKGGVYMPSLVAEIGATVEKHLEKLGMLNKPERSEAEQSILDEKRKQALALEKASEAAAEEGNGFPANSTICSKCNTKAVVVLDGCSSCLQCGDSKCQ
jgi:hypothetical protein